MMPKVAQSVAEKNSQQDEKGNSSESATLLSNGFLQTPENQTLNSQLNESESKSSRKMFLSFGKGCQKMSEPNANKVSSSASDLPPKPNIKAQAKISANCSTSPPDKEN